MITDLYTHLIEYYNLFVMKIEGCIMGVLIMSNLKVSSQKFLANESSQLLYDDKDILVFFSYVNHTPIHSWSQPVLSHAQGNNRRL